MVTYDYAWCKNLYEEFKNEYPRATELVFKIYKLSPEYVINLIKDRKFTNWYRFKAITKRIHKRMDYLEKKEIHDEMLPAGYRAMIQKLYPIQAKRVKTT